MNINEESAKKKWCPMVRFQIGPDSRTWQNKAVTNRAMDMDHHHTRCLGCGCAVWVRSDVDEGHCGLAK